MERIIVDTYSKQEKQTWGNDLNDAFNRKILAVNDMYGWLYDQGILEKVAFQFKDYEDATHFALDAKDLAPYREQMKISGLPEARLAVHHIFDENYSPCVYSGAIELGWTMMCYRGVDGCVGRSWECDLIKSLNTDGIYEVAKVKDDQGVRAAVTTLFGQFDWKPTLSERKVAFAHPKEQHEKDDMPMNVRDLNRDQLIELKQRMLIERDESTFWGELAEADTLIPDEDVFKYFDGYSFVPEDFSCSAGSPAEELTFSEKLSDASSRAGAQQTNSSQQAKEWERK